MDSPIEGLRHSAHELFTRVQQGLLPNETVQLVCETQKGFLILTSRRLVLLNEDADLGYRITKAISYSNLTAISQKKPGRYEISGSDIMEPRRISGESKKDVREYFQSTMSRCLELVEEMKISEFRQNELTSRNLSYLEDLPESLTRNAILDLNTILRDQPIHDELVHEAQTFLGSNPFLVEDSLRDVSDKGNGVLLAAGEKGYFWIQGKKRGRFISNVIIDTVEWKNILSSSQGWSNETAIITITYSLVEGGKPITKEYQWLPPINEDTLRFPWFIQPHNGPFIFEDVIYKNAGRLI